MQNIVKVSSLKKNYKNKNYVFNALKNINIEIQRGSFVAIIGPSGSGKSTLLHLLGGLDYPTEGKVFIDGINISEMKDEYLVAYRRKNIGYIFQNFNLISVLNVYENITLPLGLSGEKLDKNYFNEIIELLDIKDKLNNLPCELSGGQQQRVAIARALIIKPKIVLADEPTGNLDSESGDRVMELLLKIKKDFNQTLIMITHNKDIANTADRIIGIKDGIIIEE